MAGNTKTSNKKTTTKKTSGVSTAAKNFASITKKTSTPVKNNIKAGGGYVAPAPAPVKVDTSKKSNNNNGTYAVGTSANGGTMMSNGTVVGGMSTASNKGGTTTTKKTETSSSDYVSAKRNNNGTTTYTKANGDSWTENGKGQVVSKVVNGGGMSVAPKTSTTSKTTSTKTTTGVWTPIKTGGNMLANFANNTGTYKIANPTTGSKAVATNTDGSIRYVDGSTYNPKTGISTKATTSSGGSSNKSAAASNGLMSYDYTKNNAKGSKAVASSADGSIRYADGSTYNPATGKTTPAKTSPTSFKSNVTSILKNSSNSTVANNGFKSWDYTKNNANGSPAIQQMADGSIRYADGSIYNPKTGQTTDKAGNIVKDQNQATQVTEDDARREANDRSNRSTSGNSSTYNPVSNNKTATTNRSNQSALSIVLGNQGGKVGDKQGNIVGMQSKSLDTGGNRNIESQEKGLSDNGDGTQTYIAPNGKQYLIGTDANGNLAFVSQGDKTKGQTLNINDSEGNIINDMDALIDYIRDNNQSDGINRSNVDNKDAVRDAEIVGTYNAPSGKEYDILTNDEGKVGFVNINGDAQWFDTQAAALDYIDKNNPVGNKDLAKNTIKPEWENRVSDSIEDMVEGNKEDKAEEQDRNEDLKEFVEEMFEEWQNSQDEVDRNKYNILNQSLMDFDNFQVKLDDAVADLEEKSKLLQDNERMRWARQRAAQLAAQGYLTSEQVAQVANYSLTDYNKELEANALEAAKAVAELRLNIAQKANDALAAIRSQQFSNENDRMNQINFVNEWRTKMEDAINSKMSQVDQFYNGLINSNLAMNAQNELGYESIINQNKAQNIADDQNQMRAFTDPVYRRQYILDHITDANLHGYAAQAIQYLMNSGNFIFPGKSNNDNKRILAEQIAKVTDAARQLQLENQKDLAKS